MIKSKSYHSFHNKSNDIRQKLLKSIVFNFFQFLYQFKKQAHICYTSKLKNSRYLLQFKSSSFQGAFLKSLFTAWHAIKNFQCIICDTYTEKIMLLIWDFDGVICDSDGIWADNWEKLLLSEKKHFSNPQRAPRFAYRHIRKRQSQTLETTFSASNN